MICVMNSCFDHVSLSKMFVEKIVSVLDMDNFDYFAMFLSIFETALFGNSKFIATCLRLQFA